MRINNLNLHCYSITQAPILLFFLFFPFATAALTGLENSFVYAGCSQEKYVTNTPFESNLNSFLTSVVSSSSQTTYNSFTIGNNDASQGSTAYGLYQCRGDLKPSDCNKCIESAVNQISLVCPYSFGATIQLEGCLVRYERVNFLGALDTSLRYKKCSENSVSDDEEFFKRRDDVLSDLAAQVGVVGFKVSSSGLIEGYAQCLGDLSSSNCGSCVGEAVGQLKNLCGSAAAADVFLGQCSARYWASGYYNLPSSLSSEDDVGKTVAIIVGVIAGVAVLIVLLSICKRTMG